MSKDATKQLETCDSMRRKQENDQSNAIITKIRRKNKINIKLLFIKIVFNDIVIIASVMH